MPLARCADGSLLEDTLTVAQAQLCELLAMRRRQLDVLEASPAPHAEAHRVVAHRMRVEGTFIWARVARDAARGALGASGWIW